MIFSDDQYINKATSTAIQAQMPTLEIIKQNINNNSSIKSTYLNLCNINETFKLKQNTSLTYPKRGRGGEGALLLFLYMLDVFGEIVI